MAGGAQDSEPNGDKGDPDHGEQHRDQDERIGIGRGQDRGTQHTVPPCWAAHGALVEEQTTLMWDRWSASQGPPPHPRLNSPNTRLNRLSEIRTVRKLKPHRVQMLPIDHSRN